jgi:hypothetical protein
VLAESINAGLTSFTHTIRERQRKLRGEVGNTLPESTVSEGESHGERAKPTLVARVKPPNPGCKPEGYHPRDPESDDGASGGLAMPWQAAWVTQRKRWRAVSLFLLQGQRELTAAQRATQAVVISA